MPTRKYTFGAQDRLVIEGAAFRVDRFEDGAHILELVQGGVPKNMFVPKTDEEVDALFQAGRMRVDQDYFSRALATLRNRHDDSDLSSLDEEALRTIGWKTEWCVRFLTAYQDTNDPRRPRMTPGDMDAFILAEKDRMLQWHVDRFGVGRPPGRRRAGERRKPFDYPSASGLRLWLESFAAGEYRMEAFRPKYRKCWNRKQIHPAVLEIVNRHVPRYAASNRPAIIDIHGDIEGQIKQLNAARPEGMQLPLVSERAVRRRVHALPRLRVEAGRSGEEAALRKFLPVGHGLQVTVPLDRVEMDDWTMDMQTLLSRTRAWRNMSRSDRARVPRVRCTVTVAIDVASRCIVGFNMSPMSPSGATSRAALRTMVSPNKQKFAQYLKCEAAWSMYGRPRIVVTDEGPAFQDDFHNALRHCAEERLRPGMDPRMRGTVEAFFRRLKAFCRRYAGQTFANPVIKGDYDSEANACMLFDDLEAELIRYIVDIYHHSPHRGLGRATPASVWEDRMGRRRPDLSPRQLAVTFGFRVKETLGAHGIHHLGVAYVSDELSGLFADIGNRKLPVVVDPYDRGRIFVRVPDNKRDTIPSLHGGDYLEVPSAGDEHRGRTLAEEFAARDDLRAAAKIASKAGEPIVINAFAALGEKAEAARKRAGLPRVELTQGDYDRILRVLRARSRKALEKRIDGETPPDTKAGLGETVAISERRTPLKGRKGNKQKSKINVAIAGAGTKPRRGAPARQIAPADAAPSNAGAEKARPFGGGFDPSPEDLS